MHGRVLTSMYSYMAFDAEPRRHGCQKLTVGLLTASFGSTARWL